MKTTILFTITLALTSISMGGTNTATIRKNLAEVKECYVSRLEQRPELTGKVAMLWELNMDGTVGEATIESSTLGDAYVEDCLIKESQNWKFPKPPYGGIVTVRDTFNFSK